jgi:hypothetical protein
LIPLFYANILCLVPSFRLLDGTSPIAILFRLIEKVGRTEGGPPGLSIDCLTSAAEVGLL